MKFFNKYTIDFNSFLKKGIKPITESYGVYLVNGRMGSGKTYFTIYMAEKLGINEVYTNITSYKSKINHVHYFDTINEIVNSEVTDCIFIIDELGKKYTKESKADKDFYNFLQHSRKKNRIVFLIHQEYLQVPNWIRGVCNDIIVTRKIPILRGFFISYLGEPILNDNLEWVCDYNRWYLYKRNKSIATLYDTREQVSNL